MTNEELHAHAATMLDYDPETGLFMWKTTGKGRNIDRSAGSPHKLGFMRIVVSGHAIMAHRLAFYFTYGYLPLCIDHRNGNPRDNRTINLRACTKSQNAKNTKRSKLNTTGVQGVQQDRNRGCFQVNIQVDNKQIYIGRFRTIEEATAARLKAERKYYGEFAPSVCRGGN